jgi:hypothetical protein
MILFSKIMIILQTKAKKENVVKGFAYLPYTKDVGVSRSNI